MAGYALLKVGGSALEAVEGTIRVLEASGVFNAGAGGRRQLDGVRRLDASIMEGRLLRAGAVASIEGILHPITVARLIMERTNHVLLVGPLATQFARHFNVEGIQTKDSATPRAAPARFRKTFTLHRDLQTAQRPELETVGAVALDSSGTLASGASTGGIAVMLPGRVGDSPLIGSGIYADNTAGAVSMTGLGESIIRLAVAKEIVDRLMAGETATAAARKTLSRLVTRIAGEAGALVLTPDGRLAIRHTTPRMPAAYWRGHGPVVISDRF